MLHFPVSFMNRRSQTESAVIQLCRFTISEGFPFQIIQKSNYIIDLKRRKQCPLNHAVILSQQLLSTGSVICFFKK